MTKSWKNSSFEDTIKLLKWPWRNHCIASVFFWCIEQFAWVWVVCVCDRVWMSGRARMSACDTKSVCEHRRVSKCTPVLMRARVLVIANQDIDSRARHCIYWPVLWRTQHTGMHSQAMRMRRRGLYWTTSTNQTPSLAVTPHRPAPPWTPRICPSPTTD